MELDELRELLPEYTIESLLGEGAMGSVYKAVWQPHQKTVALKVLHENASEKTVQRFLREIRAGVNLVHPNIVRIYDGGADDLCYCTMQYIRGKTLGQLLESQSASLPFLVNVLRKIAEALHYAHGQGFIHRDVKPENILLDTSGRAFLADFGCAKDPENDPRVTELGAVVGTPDYMAPEQALGRQALLGPATDIFALGGILYEILTGRPPFARASMIKVLKAIVKEPPTPPTQVKPDTPQELEKICLCALRKRIPDRYPSASEMARDLKHWLEGDPLPVASAALIELVEAAKETPQTAAPPSPSSRAPATESQEVRMARAARASLRKISEEIPIPKTDSPGFFHRVRAWFKRLFAS